MRSRVIVLCVALVAVVAVAAWLRLNSDAQRVATAEQEASSAQLAPGNSAPGVTAAPRVALSGNSRVAAAAAAAAGVGSDSVGTAGVTQPAEIGLQIDTNGKLVKNAQTRDEMERIFVAGPEELEARRQEILDTLPPAAAREALDLMERFSNYRQALQQAIPDTSAVQTEQDALVMLDTAHALRVTYFGAELTEALFGEEERLGRGTAQGILDAGSDNR